MGFLYQIICVESFDAQRFFDDATRTAMIVPHFLTF